jgi:hypothetical protein
LILFACFARLHGYTVASGGKEIGMAAECPGGIYFHANPSKRKRRKAMAEIVNPALSVDQVKLIEPNPWGYVVMLAEVDPASVTTDLDEAESMPSLYRWVQ